MQIFIDNTEFQQKILDYIASDELDKMFNNTIFKDNPESQACKQAMIYGMVIAAMITGRCNSVYIGGTNDSIKETSCI